MNIYIPILHINHILKKKSYKERKRIKYLVFLILDIGNKNKERQMDIKEKGEEAGFAVLGRSNKNLKKLEFLGLL